MSKQQSSLRGKAIKLTLRLLGGFVLIWVLVGLVVNRTASVAGQPKAAQVELAVLQNMQSQSNNNLSDVNGGNGGIWINWRTGSNPLTTNWNGIPAYECQVSNGVPTCTSYPPREDALTDLRYLHILELYKHQHPTDTQFDSQISREIPIVKYEWAGTTNQRGWVYDELIDLHRLTGDSWYTTQANSLVNAYITNNYRTFCSCIYFSSSNEPNGYYRPEDALTEATAMVQEGVRVGNATWKQDGYNAFNFIYVHAYIAAYDVFTTQMDNVLNADGTVNSNETFDGGAGGSGAEVKMGSIAQEAQMMIHAYQATRDTLFQTKAKLILRGMKSNVNELGMWDKTYGGYCQKAAFSGSSYQSSGTPTVTCSKKELGRQLIMLDAFHVADTVGKLGTLFRGMETSMKNLATNQEYYPTGSGYLYESRQDFSLVTINGTPEDWVTSEADGAALEALFSTSDSTPW